MLLVFSQPACVGGVFPSVREKAGGGQIPAKERADLLGPFFVEMVPLVQTLRGPVNAQVLLIQVQVGKLQGLCQLVYRLVPLL